MVRVYLAKTLNTKKTHREESEWAHRLLDMALTREYPQISAPVLLGRNADGKPFLANYPQIQISLSHSRGYAACAIGEKAVGVDVEVWKTRSIRGHVVEKFHPLEREAYLKCSPEERKELFYNLWVLKESFIKTDGRGLRIPLNTFSMHAEYGEIGRVEQKLDPENYYYRLYRIDGEACSLAVCSKEAEFSEEPVWLTVPEEF